MRRALSLVAFVLLCAGVAVGVRVASAHVRLINSSNGAGLHWSNPSHISIVINAAGSDDVTDGSHFTALRNAIDAWNHVGGSNVQLVENLSPTEEARTDWPADDLHTILFDENDASGYFPMGSGTVALTPVWFDSSGKITDADVLFNGSGYAFTTSGQGAHFDICDVATHELGHLLGLDHSGWAGASMYPYVSPAVIEHRSLSLDEEHGMRHVYPSASFATISGVVRRSADSTKVAGAHVIAVDANGRTVGGTLSGTQGSFILHGLDAGTYTLYATPLDYPVSSINLSGGETIQTDFQSTFGATVAVASGEAFASGDLFVNGNSTLSLGRSNDRLPLRVIAGQNSAYFLRGAGLDSTCTLTASDPNLTVVVDAWMTSMVTFEVAAPSNSPSGHANLLVMNGAGELSVLPAALEITPPSPTVTSISAPSGPDSGGTTLTLGGTNFNPGARVVLGSHIYVDGAPNGCTVVDANTITLDTAATSSGTYDAVVIDSTGEEGRLAGAFQFVSIPTIATVFPTAGAALGGTLITITGGSFQPGAQVLIDGVAQTQVTIDSPTLAHVVTDPGVVGGPYVLEVVNPNNELATSAFSYSGSSDPSLAAISPAHGDVAGGASVTLSGSNFDVNTTVVFGADPVTGLGGTAATQVTFVDANTLLALTPSHASGSVAVIVQNPSSGQAGVLSSAFSFQSGSAGGGGCSTSYVGDPFDPSDLARGAWPFALVFAWLVLRAARARLAVREA